MNTTVTDEQIRQLAETAKPYSLALLWWGPERHMDGAEATEREHQRRMVSLRADGVIAILCPVASETLAGVAIMNVPPEEAREIMDGDPCVRARMILCEVHSCHSFPGELCPRDPTPDNPNDLSLKCRSGTAHTATHICRSATASCTRSTPERALRSRAPRSLVRRRTERAASGSRTHAEPALFG